MKNLLIKHRQIFLFIIAGGLSALIEIGSFKVFSIQLTRWFGWEKGIWGVHYPLSNIASTSLGIISNYFFSIWFVFSRGKHSKRREFTYFIFISIISTLMSFVLFQVFYIHIFYGNVLDLGLMAFSGEILSKFFAIGTVAVLNYFVKKKFVFNP